jgi:hypothetical protein
MPPSFQVDRSVPLGDSSASVTAMIRSLGRLQHANPLQPLRSDVQSMLSGSGGAATTGQPRFQAQRLPDQERETALIAAPDPVVPDRQQHMMVVHKAPRPEVTIPSTLDDGPFAEVASPVPALHPAITLPVLGTISPRTRKHIERLPRANQLELQKLREIEEKLGNIEPALIKSVTGARVSDEPGRTYGGGLYARLNKAQKRARAVDATMLSRTASVEHFAKEQPPNALLAHSASATAPADSGAGVRKQRPPRAAASQPKQQAAEPKQAVTVLPGPPGVVGEDERHHGDVRGNIAKLRREVQDSADAQDEQRRKLGASLADLKLHLPKKLLMEDSEKMRAVRNERAYQLLERQNKRVERAARADTMRRWRRLVKASNRDREKHAIHVIQRAGRKHLAGTDLAIRAKLQVR